jgi:phosphopantetheinyl transferase (holo-ACP synthase)
MSYTNKPRVLQKVFTKDECNTCLQISEAKKNVRVKWHAKNACAYAIGLSVKRCFRDKEKHNVPSTTKMKKIGPITRFIFLESIFRAS